MGGARVVGVHVACAPMADEDPRLALPVLEVADVEVGGLGAEGRRDPARRGMAVVIVSIGADMWRSPPPRSCGRRTLDRGPPAAISRDHAEVAWPVLATASPAQGAAMPRAPRRARIVSRRPVRCQVRASTGSRMFTTARRGGRSIAHPRPPARVVAHQRAGREPEPVYPSLGMGRARRTRYPEAWDVSCPCIARETPSTPCSIR